MLIQYDFKKTTLITPLNAIGTTDSTTLRTVVTNTDVNSRYVAENGSDTTGAGTIANPWKTIQFALANLAGRTIITFIRNGMIGEIHSYQNTWCNNAAFPANMVIQVEAGEKDIYIHWNEEIITTLANINNYNRLITLKLSTNLYRLICISNSPGAIRYTDNGYNFLAAATAMPLAVTDGSVCYPLSPTNIKLCVCLTGAGGIYNTQDGITYTLIPGSNVAPGYLYILNLVSIGLFSGLILAVVNNATTTIAVYGLSGLIITIVPASPITTGRAKDKQSYYGYFTHQDNIVRRYSDRISGGVDNCTGLPTTLVYKQLIEYKNKIIAVNDNALFVTNQNADNVTPPEFQQLIIPFNNIVSVGTIGKARGVHVQANEDFINNEEWLLVHCLTGTTVTRYISDDLEIWTEWSDISFGSNSTNEFHEFRNNLYGIQKGFAGQNINFMPLSSISFKNTNNTDIAVIDGFNFNGNSQNNHLSIYGIRGDIFNLGTDQKATLEIKFCNFNNYFQHFISNIWGNNGVNNCNIHNCFFNGNKITHKLIEMNLFSQSQDYIQECILINSKFYGIYAETSNMLYNTIYNNYIGIYFRNFGALRYICFYKNSIDIKGAGGVQTILELSLVNGELINVFTYDTVIYNSDPLFVDENNLDFHLQVRERLAINDKYYSIDSVCKGSNNAPIYPIPTPILPSRDFAAYYERREIISQDWSDLILDNVKSLEIDNLPIDVQSGFSYTGSYLANYKETAKKINMNFGDDRRLDYNQLHSIVDMMLHKGLKKLFPNDYGIVLSYTGQVFNSSLLKVVITPSPNFEVNELVGKWLYLFNPANPLDGYFNMIRSNNVNEIIIYDNNNVPISGTYDISIYSNVLTFNGGITDIDPSTLERLYKKFELKHPISGNYLQPNLAINVLKDLWIKFIIPFLGFQYFFKIIGNDDKNIYLYDELGYYVPVGATPIYLIGEVEFYYVRNEVDSVLLKQLNCSNFIDGGSLFGIRNDLTKPKQYEYKLDKINFYTVDEFV